MASSTDGTAHGSETAGSSAGFTAPVSSVGGSDDALLADRMRERAHTFNNVLGTLIGYADLALMLNENARLQGYLEEILKAARRGRNLVAELQVELGTGAGSKPG